MVATPSTKKSYTSVHEYCGLSCEHGTTHPSPALEAMHVVQFQDRDGQKSTKCIAKLRSGIQDCSSECKLLFGVEQRQIE